MKRNSGKRDLTEGAIVSALIKAGCTIEYAERRPYDLVVGIRGMNYLIEIKTKNSKLTESQVEFGKVWKGAYAVARTPIEALRCVGLLI